MDQDCLYLILSICGIKDIVKMSSVCKSLNILISKGDFWKMIFLRDFDDVVKLDYEKWIDYYKRRKINYGQPIIINGYIHQYNQVKQIVSYNHIKFILDNENQIYIVDKTKFLKIEHKSDVKKIYCANNFYFIDYCNDLYKINTDGSYILILNNIIDFISEYNNSDIFYVKKDGTYSLLDFDKIYDFKILSKIKIETLNYVINYKNYLLIGTELFPIKYDFKAKQLSRTANNEVLVLGLDGFVRIFYSDKFKKIKIPYVFSLGYNSFLTENGDLYSFTDDKEIFIDNNVVYVNYVIDNGENGCYIKRHNLH